MRKILKEALFVGPQEPVSTVTSRVMRAIKGKGNRSTELVLRMVLVRNGIQGWSLNSRLPGRPDFLFETKKLAVFVDGCFWHGCPRCGHTPKTRSAFWVKKFESNTCEI
jgi:DNA mismatch endonuclease (patch repair protein)